MNRRSINVLEFQKIKEQLAEECVSQCGQSKALALEPSDSLPVVERMQQETEEAVSIAREYGSNPVPFFTDVSEYLKLARLESILSLHALLEIAQCLRAVKSMTGMLLTERSDLPRLQEYGRELSPFNQVEKQISQVVLGEDEIADDASPELATIRRKMRSCNDRVREKLNGMIHNPNTLKYLQEAIITQRADRYVLPVRQEYRSMVPGIVHDQSSSGATVFIEPVSVVEIGNELKQLMAAEKNEITRILRKLTLSIAPIAEEIERNTEVLAQLDFVFAKALLAIRMNAVAPLIRDDGCIKIAGGRHPLINQEKVVPLDLRIGQDFTTLIITGPNTGGKTVALKTVGLFCIMAQSGLHLPAESGTALSVFDEVFADIGDEQSIEQSLSTFSGHMKNIVEILKAITPKSLVLFDELGAGTDPTEGAALAEAILSNLLGQGIRTLATTHYSELKEFAMTTPGVENACVEFDVSTLRPTYRLLIGVPGKSNAFEISKKLGLGEALISQAQELISKEQRRFEDVLASAEYHRQLAEKERLLAEQAHAEMVAARDKAEREKQKLEEYELKSKQKAKGEARRIIEEAQREADRLIGELHAMKKSGLVQEHEIQNVRKRFEGSMDGLQNDGEESEDQPLTTVEIGQLVHIKKMGMDANVTALPDSKGIVQLKSGLMKMRLSLSDLYEPTASQKQKRQQKDEQRHRATGAKTRVDIQNRAIRRELDVRGMALNEAIPEIDKFLDDAVLSSLGEVSIIHGNGTGILRSGIAEHLKRSPAVKKFRLGVYGEGETGVTIVTLK